MKCPRCQHVFSATPDAAGLVTCPGCNSRLRTRPAGAAATGPRPGPVAVPPPPPAPAPDTIPPSRTSPVPSPAPLAVVPPPAADPGRALDTILDELRGLRDGQREILDLLRQPSTPLPSQESAPEPLGVFDDDDSPAPPPPAAVRSRRRKTVLLIDDDPEALAAAVDALERAEVPVRSVTDGNAGVAAIAAEKPDVIVMELALKGAMAGKDVINMIKATMEWVDVPIVLYTRLPIDSQREARQIHGADEYVLKGPGSPDALVGRVIALFRKG